MIKKGECYIRTFEEPYGGAIRLECIDEVGGEYSYSSYSYLFEDNYIYIEGASFNGYDTDEGTFGKLVSSENAGKIVNAIDDANKHIRTLLRNNEITKSSIEVGDCFYEDEIIIYVDSLTDSEKAKCRFIDYGHLGLEVPDDIEPGEEYMSIVRLSTLHRISKETYHEIEDFVNTTSKNLRIETWKLFQNN